jgi:hypothetical protein
MLLARCVFVGLQRRMFRLIRWSYPSPLIIGAVFFFWFGSRFQGHKALFWLILPEIFRIKF